MTTRPPPQVRELVAKGAAGGTLIFRTDDCQARPTRRCVAQGVEFTEEPTERPYGIDCGAARPVRQPHPDHAAWLTARRRSRSWASGRPAAASRAICARRASRSAGGIRCPRRGRTRRAPSAAADGADVVLSANSAADAADAARSVLDVLRPGQTFADLNTGSPELKAELARIVAPTGAGFADVALMAPVPGKGIGTPALASGDGAARFAELLRAARHAGRDRGRRAGRRRRAQAAALDRLEGPGGGGPRGDGRGRGRRQGARRSGRRSSGSSPRPTRRSSSGCSPGAGPTRRAARTRWRPSARCCATSACRRG